jgi:hypothetical protein
MKSQGIKSLVGKKVVVYACRYIYTGVVAYADDQHVRLTDAHIVYDTGDHSPGKKSWSMVEPAWCSDWSICISAIESFGEAPF